MNVHSRQVHMMVAQILTVTGYMTEMINASVSLALRGMMGAHGPIPTVTVSMMEMMNATPNLVPQKITVARLPDA
jgi:hypothetical protein